jgi:hypothetical protein
MDEGLRLAYLAAMDIPVWLLRGSAPAEASDEVATAPALTRPEAAAEMAAAPAVVAAPAVKRQLASDLLGDLGARGSRSNRVETRVQPPVRVVAPRPAPTDAVALLLFSAGSLLFIDAAATPDSDRRAGELLGAIARALGSAAAAAQAQLFEWPPAGAALGQASPREALIGRIAKLRESAPLQHIVVMGEGPAGLLLGWDAERFAARAAGPQQLPDVRENLIVTLSCAAMLADPLLKRRVWADLAPVRPG